METSAVRVDSESHAPRCLCSATQTLSGIRDTAAVTSLGVTKGDDEETKKQKAAASAEADRHMQIMRDRKPLLSISEWPLVPVSTVSEGIHCFWCASE